MPIPDYQSIMLPLLRSTDDGREHNVGDLVDALAVHFAVTREEERELLPSGKQPVFANRIGWARTYLKKAGLLESPRRGAVRITGEGRSALANAPDRIDNAYLRRYPAFREWAGYTSPNQAASTVEPVLATGLDELTPEELLEVGYRRFHDSLARDLLDRVKQSPPDFFERLVVDLLVAMGYGGSSADAGRAIGGSGDEGIDGIIKEDRLGLDAIYIQAKRWGGTVGRPEVQRFAGSLDGQGSHKGVMITTSTFSPEARQYVTKIQKTIVLIDGQELADHMIDFGVGVDRTRSYEVKEIDLSYFEAE
ncbi:MAG: restriction endonuclease [Actinomycetota bacterium]